MARKTAYLFPGQGSQSVGMGRGLFERFPMHTRRASEVLGYPIDVLCLQDPDKRLGLTQFTQPALYVVSALHLLAQLEDEDEMPSALAGHSLGEYVALFGAGVFDFDTGLALVRERGRLMGEVAGSGMAAVTQMSARHLSDLLGSDGRFGDVDIANYNTPTQTVVSGDLTQLAALGDVVKAHGGQYIPLRVSAAFHSRFMRDAERRFAQVAAGVTFRPARTQVVANVSGEPYPQDGDAMREVLVRQISSPVRWVESIQWLQRAGVDHFLELGPGKVLTRLVESIRQAPQDSVPAARPTATPVRAKPIIVCPGQGGQHFGMGRKLYEQRPAFRSSFDACAAISQPLIGASLVDLVYRPEDPAAEFSRTLHTHVANFAFGYSMAAMLLAEGAQPCCLVGWSLGEYVALATAGAISLQQALALVAGQALDVEAHTQPSAMLAVQESVNVYYSLPAVFASADLAGIHSDKSFAVTVPPDDVQRISQALAAKGIASQRLPIRHGFHSDRMDPAAAPFKDRCAGLMLQAPSLPVFSSALRKQVHEVGPDYLWAICRSRFNFRTALLLAMQQHPGADIVDIGPLAAMNGPVNPELGGRPRAIHSTLMPG